MEKPTLIVIAIFYLFQHTNADCNGIRCPKAIIRTGYVQCIRGVCQCPSKRRAVLSDDTNSNCGVAACIEYCKAKGEHPVMCSSLQPTTMGA
ncbi:hypothetical protein YC2023_001004 [Brassica napus]